MCATTQGTAACTGQDTGTHLLLQFRLLLLSQERGLGSEGEASLLGLLSCMEGGGGYGECVRK